MNTEKPICALIIDDEPEARGLLSRLLLNLNIPLEVVGEADDVVSGCRAIRRLTPELIFLDVNLKSGTGFDLLNQLPDLEAEVIFVTAHDDFALRAFDFAALGYLLKPLNARELLTAVNRYLNRRQSGGRERLDTLLTGNDPRRPDRLVIPDMNGFRVLKLPEIIYLRGEINYTRFHLADGTELLSSRTLKDYEKMLDQGGFCRIHQSYLINVSHVTAYQRGEGGVVTMANGAELDVSRRRKRAFMAFFVGAGKGKA